MEEVTQKSVFISEQLKYNADKYKGIKEEFKKAEIILKLNTSETKFNRRLLHLVNGGLYYYSKIPANFENDKFELLQNLCPKAGLKISNVTVINKSPQEEVKNKKLYFSVVFHSSNIIDFQKQKNIKGNPVMSAPGLSKNVTFINDEGISPKVAKKGKKMTWVFSCATNSKESNEIIEEKQNKWIDLLKKNIEFIRDPTKMLDPEEEEKRKKDEEKQKEQERKKKEEERLQKYKAEEENKKKFKEMENQKKAEEEQLRKKEHEERIKREEAEQKRREEQMQELENKKKDEEMKKKKELEQKMFDEKKQKIENAWEFRFFQLCNENISSLNSFEENMKKGLKLFHFIGLFKAKSIEITKEIIDSFCLPEQNRKYHPLPSKNDNNLEHIYVINNPNLIVKLGWPENLIDEEVSNDDSQNVENSIYSDKKVKALGHEFRSYDLLADVLFLLKKKNKDFNIRVPLCSLVEYKGIRSLVVSQPPINFTGIDTLTTGPVLNGDYRFNQIIAQDMMKIATELNLKPHKFEWDPRLKSFPVILSVFTEVHQAKQEEWEEFKNIYMPNIPGADVENISKPAMSSFSSSFQNSFNIANNSTATNPPLPLYYLTKLADIFPVDIDINSKDPTFFIKRLRPEFTQEYNVPLNPDAFMVSIDSPETEIDDMEVAEAGRKLREESLPQLLNQLEKLEVLPIDSYSISQIFHAHGINIRFFGWIASNTTLPHIKEICQIEMIARTCKKICRFYLAETIMNWDKEKNNKTSNNNIRFESEKKIISGPKNISQLLTGWNGKSGEINPAILEKINEEIAEIVVDFFNLILGFGPETDVFWSDILSKQVKHDFSYLINQKEVVLGGLLHAMCYHCKAMMKFENKIELGLKNACPFKKEDFLGLQIKAKVFQMKNIEIRLLSEKYREYRENKNFELATKAATIRISIDKALGFPFPPDITILSDLAELYLEQGDQENAVARAKNGIEALHPFHAEAVKFWCVLMRCHMRKNEVDKALECFDKTLSILEFHLGPFHALHATVYSIFGFYYAEKKRYDDAVLLYKSSLVCCLRILGANHVQTGEVYLDLANLYLKMNQREDALGLYEKAFSIFEIHKNETPIQYANSGFQIAHLLSESGRAKEACDVALIVVEIFEQNEEKMQSKLIECCEFIFHIAQILNDKELTIDYAEKTWDLLNKNAIQTGNIYEKCMKSIMTILLREITTEKKNYLFRLYDCIVDCLQTEKEQFINEEDEDFMQFKADALQYFIDKSKNIITITEYIRNMLFSLFNNSKDLYSSNFFIDYKYNLENLRDFTLKDALEDFEKFIIILGIDYFYNILKI